MAAQWHLCPLWCHFLSTEHTECPEQPLNPVPAPQKLWVPPAPLMLFHRSLGQRVLLTLCHLRWCSCHYNPINSCLPIWSKEQQSLCQMWMVLLLLCQLNDSSSVLLPCFNVLLLWENIFRGLKIYYRNSWFGSHYNIKCSYSGFCEIICFLLLSLLKVFQQLGRRINRCSFKITQSSKKFF